MGREQVTKSQEDQTTSGAAAGEVVVSIRQLEKTFARADGSKVPAIDDITIDVHAGEFLVLLGPSGCGKTTLLRSIAGLERPDSGEITVRGRSVFSSAAGIDIPPERRGLSMIFQSYALWPHMTVFQNVVYPLRNVRPRMTKQEMAERVRSVLDLLGIAALEKQHPSQMSGGQQQRVALARALVSQQDLVLFDEPLSNVDAKVREQLRMELQSMQAKIGFSAIYVTHDQTEAMELADRVAVLGEGRIEQLGTPHEIYAKPRTRYVANFIGTSNEVPGVVSRVGDDGEFSVTTGFGTVEVIDHHAEFAEGDRVVLIARPEHFQLARRTDEPLGVNQWEVEGRTTMFLGAHSEHLVALGALTVRIWSADSLEVAPGERYVLEIEPRNVRVLPGAG